MCIMVKEIGNGNPKNDKMYLLNKITPEERPIQEATYPYAINASFINAEPAIGAIEEAAAAAAGTTINSFFYVDCFASVCVKWCNLWFFVLCPFAQFFLLFSFFLKKNENENENENDNFTTEHNEDNFIHTNKNRRRRRILEKKKTSLSLSLSLSLYSLLLTTLSVVF